MYGEAGNFLNCRIAQDSCMGGGWNIGGGRKCRSVGEECTGPDQEEKNQSVKFKMHKMSPCSSLPGSAASIQLDMLITSISFTSLDGSDVPEVISCVAFGRHAHHRVADWQQFQ